MYYVYLLQSKGDFSQLFIGQTSDLRARLREHNTSLHISTKRYAPWKVIYYEAYPKRHLAFRREKKLKYHAKSLTEIKKRLDLIHGKSVG